MLNRQVIPEVYSPSLPQIKLGQMEKGEPGLIFVPSSEEVCRIDLEFNMGILNQSLKGAFAAIKSLIFSGTYDKSEEDIMNELDGLGAYYGAEYDYNRFTVSLYSTPILVKKALPVFLNAVLNPIFPETKLKLFQSRSIAELDQNLEKTGYLARTLCNENFFETECLKRPTSKDEILSINSSDLMKEFNSIKESGFSLYVCGNVNNLDWLTQDIGLNHKVEEQGHFLVPEVAENYQSHYHKHRAGSVQTSLRGLGMSIGKNHPNFAYTLLANMVFGGYFGSLLMQNIREEKGLTYGINSSLKAHGSYSILNISSDIKSGNINEVIAEISKEFNKLTAGNFTVEMLEKTRTYLLGTLAKSCDNLFSNLEKTKQVRSQSLDSRYYEKLFAQVQQATKEDILHAANEHLSFSDICFATCGAEQY